MNPKTMKTAGMVISSAASLADLVLRWQEHKTERVRIQADAQVERERFECMSRVVDRYFEQAFQERRYMQDELLKRLDHSLASHDIDAVNAVLGTMVTLAKQQPMDALASSGMFQKALASKTDWEL